MPEQTSQPNIKEATAQTKISCPACGGEMTQKSRARLLAVGAGMIVSIVVAFVFPLFWAPGIVCVLTGVYLLVWATLGKARWCRNCKKFSVSS